MDWLAHILTFDMRACSLPDACAMQGINPSLYEMSLKMTTIQKLLIAKTEECIEKDLLLQQKDQTCAALRAMVARRPGPEVSQQLSLSKRAVGCKIRQMKVPCFTGCGFSSCTNQWTAESLLVKRSCSRRHTTMQLKSHVDYVASLRAVDRPTYCLFEIGLLYSFYLINSIFNDPFVTVLCTFLFVLI